MKKLDLPREDLIVMTKVSRFALLSTLNDQVLYAPGMMPPLCQSRHGGKLRTSPEDFEVPNQKDLSRTDGSRPCHRSAYFIPSRSALSGCKTTTRREMFPIIKVQLLSHRLCLENCSPPGFVDVRSRLTSVVFFWARVTDSCRH